MKVTLRSKVTPVELIVRPDRQGYIVEDEAAGQFYEMSELCVLALERMRDGGTMEAIEAELSARFPDEDVDMVGFAEQLVELRLVAELDGVAVSTEPPSARAGEAASRKLGGFDWIPESFARLWFSPFMRLLYAFAIVANAALLVAKPELLPHYRDVFVFDSMALNSVTWLAVSFALLMLHEFGHIMAVRSFGLSARLGVGHRFVFVVLETEMDGIWRLTPQQRNRAYFAGMGVDMLMLLVALSAQTALSGDAEWASGLAALAAFDLVVKLVFQCCFYMKTDLYYVVENVTGCYNLMERSREWLAAMLKRSGHPTRGFAELRTVKGYALFYAAGYGFSIGLIALYFAPQLVVSLTTVVSRLTLSPEEGAFWDAIVFAAEAIGLGTLLVYAWRKKRRSPA